MDASKSAVRIEALKTFIAKEKFGAEGSTLYTGVQDPTQRARWSNAMNALAMDLMPLNDKADPKPLVLSAFEKRWPAFEDSDTVNRPGYRGGQLL